MGWKSKYYEVFGLTETATKSEVKRQYRKLAMKFHPDRNPDPKAHKLFLDLTEAYQILMDDSAARPTRNIRENDRSKSADEQRQERFDLAQKRYQEYLKRQQIAVEMSFKKFTSGARWLVFKATAIFTFALGVFLFIDHFLPTHWENHIILSSSSPYSGLNSSSMSEIHTDKNLNVFITDFEFAPNMRIWPAIEVERSRIFHNPIGIKHTYQGMSRYFTVDFSVVNLFPFLSLFLFIPAITLFAKNNSAGFYLSVYFSQYIVLGFAIYIFLSQNRWLHFFTFGFL